MGFGFESVSLSLIREIANSHNMYVCVCVCIEHAVELFRPRVNNTVPVSARDLQLIKRPVQPPA